MAHLSQLQNRKEHLSRDYQNQNPLASKSPRGNGALLGSARAHRFERKESERPEISVADRVTSFVKAIDRKPLLIGAAVVGGGLVAYWAAKKWWGRSSGAILGATSTASVPRAAPLSNRSMNSMNSAKSNDRRRGGRGNSSRSARR